MDGDPLVMKYAILELNSRKSKENTMETAIRLTTVEENTKLVVFSSRSPKDLATSTEPPTPKSMVRKLKKIITGIVRLTAEMASGPINRLSTMASVVMAICEVTDAKIEAHMNLCKALAIK